MYALLLTFSLFLSTARLARAHGFISSVTVAGQTYPGWNPFADPYSNPPPRVVRKVLNDGFVEGTDPDINCHHEGDAGTAAIAQAAAGSDVKWQWAYWPGEHQGPVSTYMTSCGDDCSTFSANSARWFKVDAVGYDPATKQWGAGKLMADGNSWTSKIPANLAPGKYLMRHEIIALHAGTPQFYPSCLQLEVTGNGSGRPSESELVSMQDMYRTATFPNIYGESVSFTIPGPPVASLNGSGGGSNPAPSPSSPASSSTATTTTSTSPTGTGSPAPPKPTGVAPPPGGHRACGLSSRSKLARRSRSL